MPFISIGQGPSVGSNLCPLPYLVCKGINVYLYPGATLGYPASSSWTLRLYDGGGLVMTNTVQTDSLGYFQGVPLGYGQTASVWVTVQRADGTGPIRTSSTLLASGGLTPLQAASYRPMIFI